MEKEALLTELKNGERGVVARIGGGGALLHKLGAMGILPGREITRRSSASRGPVIVEVLRSRVAIGRGIAEKIRVTRP